MNTDDFELIRNQFKTADTEQKIDIYVNSGDLTQEQYRELLKMFPMNELPRLEYALTER